jgi:hypothetical protein
MRHAPWTHAAILITLAASAGWAASGPIEAVSLIGEMSEAHGGLERWRRAPSASWVDIWSSPGGSGPRSRIAVEQGRRRATIDIGEEAEEKAGEEAADEASGEMHMAWDGEKAWSENWQMPYPPRFYALLNYYFLNMPWVAHDDGVKLSEPGKAKLWDDPVEYETVKLTYEPGVGDTPDDYYVLYIHPESHRLHAVEYIVTYESILPEGMEHSPPHILIYDEFEEVDGLVVPTKFTIYEDEAFYAGAEMSEWSFEEPFDESKLAMPEGAVVDESVP